MRDRGGPTVVFLVLLTVLSAAAYALILHQHRETAALSRFVMWCPGMAALGTSLVLGVPLRRLGWGWPAGRWLRLAYALPLLYAVPVYAVTWLAVPGAFEPGRFLTGLAAEYGLGGHPVLGSVGVGLPLLFTIAVIGTCTWALGEEIGWRGFLFPRLERRFGVNAACFLSGLLWAVWHYPGLLGADYNAGTNPVFAVVCFSVMVVAMGFVMGLLRTRSGSLWPCVLLHATHNVFLQALLDPLTGAVGRAKYVTTEFGVGTAAAMVVTAVVLVRRSRREAEMFESAAADRRVGAR